MISFVLFVFFITLTPVLFLVFLERLNANEPVVKAGAFAILSFLLATVFSIKGSALGAGILFFCVVAAVVMEFVLVLISKKLSKHPKKSVVFRSICRKTVFFVFFLIGSCVTFTYMFNGLYEVLFTYELSVNAMFVNCWWALPVVFGLVTALAAVSKDIRTFFKQAVGYLVVVVGVVMLVGEVARHTVASSIVVAAGALEEAMRVGGYARELVLGLSTIANVLGLYVLVLVAGLFAAFVLSAVNQFFVWKRKNAETRMKISSAISVETMRKSDAYTIENFVPGRELMRRAAQGIFDAADWEGKKIAIVAGSGNNGGDGYALSAILAEKGIFPVVFRVSDRFSEDGRFFYEKARELGIKDEIFDENTRFDEFDTVVDCIFGTGFKGIPEGASALAIKRINESGAFVISADINSGLDGDSGEAELAVKSDLTVSIGFYKKGMFTGKAPELVGELVNVDIGIVLV